MVFLKERDRFETHRLYWFWITDRMCTVWSDWSSPWWRLPRRGRKGPFAVGDPVCLYFWDKAQISFISLPSSDLFNPLLPSLSLPAPHPFLCMSVTAIVARSAPPGLWTRSSSLGDLWSLLRSALMPCSRWTGWGGGYFSRILEAGGISVGGHGWEHPHQLWVALLRSLSWVKCCDLPLLTEGSQDSRAGLPTYSF